MMGRYNVTRMSTKTHLVEIHEKKTIKMNNFSTFVGLLAISSMLTIGGVDV